MSLKDPDDFRMPLGAHLDDLRACVLRALAGILVATLLCMLAAKPLFSVVMRPAYLVLKKYGQDPALQSLSPPDSFMLYMKLALLCGLIVSSPWVLWQAWSFVASGLYPRERRYAKAAVLPSMLLFALGVVFMYLIVLPVVLNFFVSFNLQFPVPDWKMSWLEEQLIGVPEPLSPVEGISPLKIAVLGSDPPSPQPGDLWFDQTDGRLNLHTVAGTYELPMRRRDHATAITNQYSIDFYASFILQLSLAFGLAFQLPMGVVGLVLTRLVTTAKLARFRGHIILGITIAAAILTPPDVVSQIMLGIPMVVLFELGMIAARILERRRDQAAS